MKKVPFVENTVDDMHCVNAVFRMVHQYFFDNDLSWQEIDKLTKAVEGKATWTLVGEMEFVKLGLDVTNIEPVDYERLYTEGLVYLRETFGEDTAKYYISESNIGSVIEYIPDYLKLVKHETRRATVDEIAQFVKDGALVGAEVNSTILNHLDGFSLHFILIYDCDDSGFYVHDPGLPPIEARYVTFDEFDRSLNFPGANGGITVFRSGEVKVDLSGVS